MTETELRKPVVKQLRSYGAMVTPVVGHMRGDNGTPDVHIIHPTWSGWCEFKGPKTLRKPLQEKFVFDARERGYNALFLRLFNSKQGRLEWPVEYVGAIRCSKTEGGKTFYKWMNLDVCWDKVVLEVLNESKTNR